MAGELYPTAGQAGALVSAGTVRALRAWSAPDRQRLAAAIAGAQRAWLEAWGLGGREARAAAAPGILTPFDSDWAEQMSPAVKWLQPWPSIWWAFAAPAAAEARRPTGADDASYLAAIRGALFAAAATPWTSSRGGEDRGGSPGTIADAVARASWDDWCARLASAFRCEVCAAGDGERGPPAATLSPWSGSLLVTLPWLDGTARLLVGPERIEGLAPADPRPRARAARRPITPVWRAAGGRPVPLRVTIEPFELEIGALAGLRVGDVLRTDHRLDVPLEVAMDDSGATVCAAHLGRVGWRRAAELLPSDAAMRETDAQVGREAARSLQHFNERTR